MPRIRSSVRNLLIAVAIASVLLWSALMLQRSAKYRAVAADHASAEWYWSEAGSQAAEPLMGGGLWTRDDRVKFFRDLRLKYERAARYPWLSVEPDPPTPQIAPPL
jgi:hypothetical protein